MVAANFRFRVSELTTDFQVHSLAGALQQTDRLAQRLGTQGHVVDGKDLVTDVNRPGPAEHIGNHFCALHYKRTTASKRFVSKYAPYVLKQGRAQASDIFFRNGDLSQI